MSKICENFDFCKQFWGGGVAHSNTQILSCLTPHNLGVHFRSFKSHHPANKLLVPTGVGLGFWKKKGGGLDLHFNAPLCTGATTGGMPCPGLTGNCDSKQAQTTHCKKKVPLHCQLPPRKRHAHPQQLRYDPVPAQERFNSIAHSAPQCHQGPQDSATAPAWVAGRARGSTGQCSSPTGRR